MKITDWKVEGHHTYPAPECTIISAVFDGIKRQVTLYWKDNKLFVSATNATDSAYDSQTFDIPNTDFVDFLEENMK